MKRCSLITISIYITVGVSFCFLSCTSRAQHEDYFMEKRKRMVEEQIKRRGVKDKKVLEALLKVPRHLFVPPYEESFAYEDGPLPIGHGQTISQPYIVAYMTEAARLDSEDKILEIGTGSGYQAAVLAEIAKEVYSIEIIKELAQSAQQRLSELGYTNIHIRHGDGYKGWPEEAPFDAIIVTAAPPEVPQALLEQLKTGGRLVIPVGTVYQELLVITKTKDGLKKKSVFPVRFVPMVKGKQRSGDEE